MLGASCDLSSFHHRGVLLHIGVLWQWRRLIELDYEVGLFCFCTGVIVLHNYFLSFHLRYAYAGVYLELLMCILTYFTED
jgi:hypothetical protein